MTIIGLSQAQDHCKEYGGTIRKSASKHTCRFGYKRHDNVSAIRIRMPITETKVIDIDADVVEVDMPILLGLDNLTKLKALLDIGNDTITSKNMKWEVPLTRKRGQLYVEWPK